MWATASLTTLSYQDHLILTMFDKQEWARAFLRQFHTCLNKLSKGSLVTLTLVLDSFDGTDTAGVIDVDTFGGDAEAASHAVGSVHDLLATTNLSEKMDLQISPRLLQRDGT